MAALRATTIENGARRRPRRRRPPLALVGVVLSLVAMPQGVGAQSAGPRAGTFNGTASSELVRVIASPEPAILLDPLLDPGVTMAQAAADSLGTSTAYAKSVFPGTLYGLLPGLGSLTGAALPVPANPLEVASSHPSNPEADQSAGTITLRAASDPTSSSGSATNGVDEATASVVADVERGDVVSSATAALGTLRISDLLELHGVRTFTRAARTSAGELERSSSLELAAISVAGQRVALTPGTLELLGTPTELPLLSPIRTLLATLTSAGITMEFVPAVELEDGIQSAALRIDYAVQPPQDAGFSGVENIRVVVTVGGAIATAGSGAIGPSITPAPAVPTGATPSAAPLAPAASSGGTPARGATVPAPSTGPAPAVAPPAAAVADPALTSLVVPDLRSSIAAFYPVLVLAAGLLYGLARSSTHLGGDRR